MSETAKRPLEAVANPVRLAIVARLAHADASLDELADAVGVHRNTVRAHCAGLVEDGVVSRFTHAEPGRPGRPETRYRLAPGVDLGGAADALPRLLAAALAGARPASSALRSLGRDWARARVATQPGRAAAPGCVRSCLADLGFDASVGRSAVTLANCPCPVVSPGSPEVVCGLVAGCVDGLLEAAGADERVAGGSHDPDSRRCTLALAKPARSPG